jgi:peptidoglycan/LPS O-acetylase OafA/YrhL
MVAILATSLGEKSTSFYVVWLPIAIAGSALVVGYLAMGQAAPWIRRMLEASAVQYLGRISYGLYLWHYTVYFVVKKNVTTYPVKPVLQIVLSLVVAALSYRFLELRFLRLKSRFRPAASDATLVPS